MQQHAWVYGEARGGRAFVLVEHITIHKFSLNKISFFSMFPHFQMVERKELDILEDIEREEKNSLYFCY